MECRIERSSDRKSAILPSPRPATPRGLLPRRDPVDRISFARYDRDGSPPPLPLLLLLLPSTLLHLHVAATVPWISGHEPLSVTLGTELLTASVRQCTRRVPVLWPGNDDGGDIPRKSVRNISRICCRELVEREREREGEITGIIPLNENGAKSSFQRWSRDKRIGRLPR